MGAKDQMLEVRFPLNRFLHQLFFTPLNEVVWSPEKFWCAYKLQLLEQCWKLDFIQYTNFVQQLEYCWLKSLYLETDSSKNSVLDNTFLRDPKDNQGQKL